MKILYKLCVIALTAIIVDWCGMTSAYSQKAKCDDVVLTSFEVTLEGDTLTFPLCAPAVLQQTMWERGLIPHPFVGSNEDSIQWVSDRNWLLKASFDITPNALHDAREYWLMLPQVDTFADIYLNGVHIGRTDNLFRHHQYEVRQLLRVGTNRLVIRLLSPTREAHALYLSTGFNYPADNDRHEVHYAPLVRKSQYHFGWDWGPRIVTMGLGAPVILTARHGATIDMTRVSAAIEWDSSTQEPHAKSATVTVLHAVALASEGTEVSVELLSPEGQTLQTRTSSVVRAGAETTIEVRAPQLWMPNGWGEQPIYAVVSGVVGSAERDTTYFGIREIRLDMSKDSIGQMFTFVVNRKPLYVKGANYLPHDRRFGGGGRTLRQLFEQDIVPAHFNMLRLWGGGDWETEEFYRLADKHGILIWQDLPFACSTYPNDPAFRDNVAVEIRDQLSRIANHPSIALLCGNNEVLEGLKHWGWQSKYGYSDEIWAQMHRDYDDFFRIFLAHEVATYAPDVDYIHGSPVSSNWGIPESLLSGDSHYWGVWFGGEDFDTFERNHGRFASEYGFQSFPEMKTIQSFDPSVATDTMSIYSPLLTKRQRSFIGNERIEEYMKRSYPVPTDFGDFVYVGQVLHGRGMGEALRAIRRSYPVNMGSLYWQLNDVWPTVSWSGIDYWGNYKAFQYEVRQAYAPVIVDVVKGSEGLDICVVTDDPHGRGMLTVTAEVLTYTGKKKARKDYNLDITSTPSVVRRPLDLEVTEGTMVYLVAKDAGEKVVAKRVFHPQKPKEMKLPSVTPKMQIKAKRGVMTVTLTTDVLAMDVFVETPWQGARYSDNFFDLLPNTSHTITITHPDINPTNAKGAIVVHTMNEIVNRYK